MNIREYISKNTLILDGAMGSLLMERGLRPGERGEGWNLTHPDAVTDIHRAYFDAGSRMVLTNTFGANRLHFDPAQLRELVAAAVENARRAAAGEDRFVALDIGPCGQMLEPLGDLEEAEAAELFAETAELGLAAGVDAVFIETMNDLTEARAALTAVKPLAGDVPVFVSNSYGANGRLLTGARPGDVVPVLEALGAEALGLNCSLGPAAMAPLAEEYQRLTALPVIFKPNAGLPELRHGRTVYNVTPEDFAAAVAAVARRGVKLVGGCCGTGPAYIEALTRELQK